MANRTRQARHLALYLSNHSGVDVEVSYLSGDQWEIRWPGGPTEPQMRDLAAPALPDGLRDRRLTYTRGESDRALAARAVAAYRDGTLAAEVARRAPLHRHNPSSMTHDWTPEDYAFLAVVRELVENTPFPDRPSAPEDTPLIDHLLVVSRGQHREMGRLLLSADLAADFDAAYRPPTPAAAPPTRPALRLVRGTEDDTRD